MRIVQGTFEDIRGCHRYAWCAVECERSMVAGVPFLPVFDPGLLPSKFVGYGLHPVIEIVERYSDPRTGMAGRIDVYHECHIVIILLYELQVFHLAARFVV